MDTKHTPEPWRALRWWESAGMTLADAADDAERAEWESAPYLRIEGANGKTVVACHDLSKISHADARLIVEAPAMHAALDTFVQWFDDMRRTDEGRALLMSMAGSTAAFGAYDNARAILARIKGKDQDNGS